MEGSTGESQRKDGRYAYKYTDACGKTQFVYAWKLVPTDKTPTGKRDDISLREKVKEILRDLNDGIDTIGKKMTVCQLYARQNSHRKNVKRSTEKGREYLMSVLKSDPLGSRSIDTVKLSDAKEWAIRMSEKGYAYKTQGMGHQDEREGLCLQDHQQLETVFESGLLHGD